MAEERVKRKLTTILAADVEGYSRLMSADEEATLNTLGEYRKFETDCVSPSKAIYYQTWPDAGSASGLPGCHISWVF